MGYDTGIADRLRAGGLNVVEVAGWRTRGSSMFNPRGSIDHHTAGPRNGNMPSLGILIKGRPDLPGPLCNVGVARDNTCYVIAAGRANHAGSGGWRGLSGNSSVYGVERENVGTTAEPWRADQTETSARVHAALLSGPRVTAEMLCLHREWTPRKPDAHSISGPALRARVARLLGDGPRPPMRDGNRLVDFSFQRPRPDQIRHAGIITYLSDDTRKVCSPAEIQAYRDAGLSINFVGQDGKTDWMGGFAAGQAKGIARNRQADALGAPTWLPIIHTLQDSDLTEGNYGLVAEYVRGLRSVPGRSVGRYGGGRLFIYLDAIFGASTFPISWLAAATSWGGYSGAHLQQHPGATHHPIPGVATDDNTILRPFPRWGHTIPEEDDMFSDDDRKVLYRLAEQFQRRSTRCVKAPDHDAVFLVEGEGKPSAWWVPNGGLLGRLAQTFGFDPTKPEGWNRSDILAILDGDVPPGFGP